MLEPPTVSADELVERTRKRYGLPVDGAEFLPVGDDSSAWAFRLSAGDARWFLKALARPVDPACLEIPRYLVARGMAHIVAPVPTVTGAAYDAGEPFNLIVYPFFEGEQGGDVGLTTTHRIQLGQILRHIHDAPITEGLTRIMRRERFIPPALETARSITQEIRSSSSDDRLQRTLATFWREHDREIEHIMARTDALGSQARRRVGKPVICHADFHSWNVLVDPSGDFVVVDWDETLLAPPERDLMFVDGGVGNIDAEGSAFYAGYGEVEIDPVVIAYYRFDWVVQELADYGRRVFRMPDLGEDTRADAVDKIAEVFGPGGVVEAALQADERLSR